MKRLPLFPLFVLLACSPETTVPTGTFDTREPVAIRYVGAPELPVYTQPSDTAPVIATYQNGEAIPVLAEKGDWVEVRTGDRAGWAHAAALSGAAEKKADQENPTPKFRVMPMPVSAPGAHGEIAIEATVNSDGDVTNVKLLANTTDSAALAEQNAAALRGAKFYPIIRKNARMPFLYYHKVTY